MYMIWTIANHKSTMHQVRKSGIYRDQSIYQTVGWGRKRAIYVCNSMFKNCPRIQIRLITKYPLPKARKTLEETQWKNS
jgi:hypothetical protein